MRRRLRLHRQQPLGQHASRFVQVDRARPRPSDEDRRARAARGPESSARAAPVPRTGRAIRPTSPIAGQPAISSMIGSANVFRYSSCCWTCLSPATLGLVAAIVSHRPRGSVCSSSLCFPFEPTRPARGIAADHRRIDDERFPAPGRAQRSCEDWIPSRDPGSGIRDPRFRSSSLSSAQTAATRPECLVLRRSPSSPPPFPLSERDLRKRQVLGKPGGGQLFGGACEQRQECPAGRQAATRAATEPRRHLCPAQRMLDETDVVLWRAHQHGHLVEAHTGCAPREESAAQSQPPLAPRLARRRTRVSRPAFAPQEGPRD